MPFQPPHVRTRRSAKATRALAVEAAHQLLLRDGPRGVTLTTVAAALDMGHANLLHHFGSAAALRDALIERMLAQAVAALEAAAAQLRTGTLTPRALVDLVFDACKRDGMDRLLAWLSSTGEGDRLRPLVDAVAGMMRSLRAGSSGTDGGIGLRDSADLALALTLAALGDALLGDLVHGATGTGRDHARELLTAMISHRLRPSDQGRSG